MKNFYLILGPQGSGKTTQGKMLAEKLGYKFVSTGELLREAKDSNNPLGIKLSEYWAKGDLVPDELIESILYPILESFDVEGFVIDGYPRTPDQLTSLLSFLDMNNWPLVKAIYFDISREECLVRIKHRSETQHRIDETDEALHRRLDIYYQETQPLLDKYKAMNVLLNIDAHPSIEDIHKDVVQQLGLQAQ